MRRVAPWKQHHEHLGQDPWNHTKSAREHPELYTSAYGTVDSADERELQQQFQESEDSSGSVQASKKRSSKKDSSSNVHGTEEAFGHTVHPPRVPQRPVKRDLDQV